MGQPVTSVHVIRELAHLLLILCAPCASAVNLSRAAGTIPKASSQETAMNPPRITRRQFLHNTGGGLGALAASYLLAQDLAAAAPPAPRADLNGGLHHRAK